MADESTSTPKTAEPRYTPAELAERAREVGCSRHAIAGALSGLSEPDFTIAQAKAHVDRFMGQKAG